MNKDIFFENEGQQFRLRACGIIIRDQQVLMVKNEQDRYYYAVGGAIKQNETTEEAVIREVFEETGLRLEIDRLLYVHQNFFTFRDKPFHELAFYYLMKDNLGAIQSDSYNFEGVKEHMVFLPINTYHTFEAYPKFFAEALKNIKEDVSFITTRE